MIYEIGSEGQEANIILPQGTSLNFSVVHKDEEGNVIDHSASVGHMAFQGKNGNPHWKLDDYVTCDAEAIYVRLPGSLTDDGPVGKMRWDLIVDMSDGETVMLLHGTVSITDTCSLDGD